jgi:hypothetical protein
MGPSGICRGLGAADYAGERRRAPCRSASGELEPQVVHVGWLPVDPWSVRTRVVGWSCWRILGGAGGLSHLPTTQGKEVRDVHEGDLGN